MKRFICFGLAFAFFAGCAAAADKAPDQYLWDFGRIAAAPRVSHVFTLANNGKKDLKVTGKTNSCGCTESEISRKLIPPGESAEVKVTFNPAGYSGPVEQFVYVNTDDPDNPVYRFSIKAAVAG